MQINSEVRPYKKRVPVRKIPNDGKVNYYGSTKFYLQGKKWNCYL